AEAKHKCSFCGRGFLKLQNLQRHVRTHTGEKPFFCNICGRGFVRMQNLQRHVRTHTGEKPYFCNLCDYRAKISSSVYRHIRYTKEDRVTCPHCFKLFGQAEDLRRHVRTHTGEKPYMCTQCQFRSAVRSSVVRHKRNIHGTTDTSVIEI
ncbi:UNVERIFIED_CONTAM: hypothetical protein GTU68_014409, partial [Idotea baltica]|nr:hypothetical protein [Idotea baltica]